MKPTITPVPSPNGIAKKLLVMLSPSSFTERDVGRPLYRR